MRRKGRSTRVPPPICTLKFEFKLSRHEREQAALADKGSYEPMTVCAACDCEWRSHQGYLCPTGDSTFIPVLDKDLPFVHINSCGQNCMYGTGTRSYNRSTEKKQSNRDRHTFTVAYMADPNRKGFDILPVCTCSEHELPHEAHSDELAVFRYHQSLRYVRSDISDPGRAETVPARSRSRRRPQRLQHQRPTGSKKEAKRTQPKPDKVVGRKK